MKVYVVSECIDGENGYREVIKVFSTLEKAKEYVNSQDDKIMGTWFDDEYETYLIEEFEVDKLQNQ